MSEPLFVMKMIKNRHLMIKNVPEQDKSTVKAQPSGMKTIFKVGAEVTRLKLKKVRNSSRRLLRLPLILAANVNSLFLENIGADLHRRLQIQLAGAREWAVVSWR
jgi:hypothetical protein